MTHTESATLPPLASSPPLSPRDRIDRLYAIDLRALAVFRMALGALLLCDLGVRLADLGAHYTDAGLLPRSVLIEQFLNRWDWSIFLLSGNPVVVGGLFVLFIVAAVLLMVGWRSRLMALVCWILLVSLHVRNDMVLHGGDVLYRLLLLWAIFLPIGARWSVDALLNPQPVHQRSVISVASAALLLQVAFMYLFSVVHKSGDVWWNGRAVSMALQLDEFATPLAKYLLAVPALMVALTWGTLLLEGIGPMIAFLPFGTGRIRIGVVLSFWMLHLGMGLMLALGLFPWTCAAAWIPFLPVAFWDGVERRFHIDRWRPGVVARWIMAHAPARPIRVRPTVANTILAMAFLCYLFLWNVRTINFEYWQASLPRSMNGVGTFFRLDQSWTMFSPYPARDDGWYVIPAQLADGTEVDLWTGQPVDWRKPPLVAATYRNSRERKYMLNLWLKDNAAHRPHFARYLCRRWNESHPATRRVKTFEIYFMLEPTQLDQSVPKAEPVLLWSHDCNG